MKLLINPKKMNSILIADKPLLEGGQIRNISNEQFIEIFGCPYSEEICLDESVGQSELLQAHENICSNLTSTQICKQIASLLENPPQNLVICKINDDVGYGLFTQSKIRKYEVIALYSGDIIRLTDKSGFNGTELQYWGTNFAFQAKRFRGLASFMCTVVF